MKPTTYLKTHKHQCINLLSATLITTSAFITIPAAIAGVTGYAFTNTDLNLGPTCDSKTAKQERARERYIVTKDTLIAQLNNDATHVITDYGTDDQKKQLDALHYDIDEYLKHAPDARKRECINGKADFKALEDSRSDLIAATNNLEQLLERTNTIIAYNAPSILRTRINEERTATSKANERLKRAQERYNELKPDFGRVPSITTLLNADVRKAAVAKQPTIIPDDAIPTEDTVEVIETLQSQYNTAKKQHEAADALAKTLEAFNDDAAKRIDEYHKQQEEEERKKQEAAELKAQLEAEREARRQSEYESEQNAYYDNATPDTLIFESETTAPTTTPTESTFTEATPTNTYSNSDALIFE